MEELLDNGGPLLFWEEATGEGSPRKGLEINTWFCPEPTCNVAHVDVLAAEQSGGSDTPRPCLSAAINVDTTEVGVGPTPAPGSLEADLLERLYALLERPEDSFLELLQKRFRHARGESKEDWRGLDWSWWEPGLLVFFDTLFPDAPQLLFHSGGEQIWAEDGYCLQAGCACREITLAFTRTGGEATEPLCALTVDLNDWTIGTADVDGGGPPSDEQKRLFQDLQEAFSDLRRMLAARREELQRLGPEIRALAGEEQRPVRQGQATPGRNDPCFCGSGKKYKKCCLGSEVTYEAGDYRTKRPGA